MSIFDRFKRDPVDLSHEEIRDLIKMRATRQRIREVTGFIVLGLLLIGSEITIFVNTIDYFDKNHQHDLFMLISIILMIPVFGLTLALWVAGLEDKDNLTKIWAWIKRFIKSFIYKDKKGD